MIVVLVTILGADRVAAQAPDRTRVWLALGWGPGSAPVGDRTFVPDKAIDAVILQAAFQRSSHQLALRYAIVAGRRVGLTAFSERAVTYGRTRTGRLGHATVSTGLSLVSACISYTAHLQLPDDCSYTMGVPIVAEVALRPPFIPLVGLGGQAFANFNNSSVFGGLVVFLQAGWMP